MSDNEDFEEFEEFTVRDHLDALGRNEKWLETLAEMIIEFTDNDTAIATTRAIDLANHIRFGKSISFMIKGYLGMLEELENGTDLTPNQRETIRQLLRGMYTRTAAFFPDGLN
ncbi:MAG: hypothetical protein IJI14_15975 [Anaerolineaceae bacterium]|nr:hypothetical protein [Anaerolineaceae bacterium]